MLKIYFVRHGESEANLLNEFSNRGIKHPLTEKGRQEAYALAERLKKASIRRIYHSPVLRALETAEILANELDVPRESCPPLREFDVGDLEGRSDEAAWNLYWEISNAWVRDHAWQRRFQGGENFIEIKKRFVPFVEQVIAGNKDIPGNVIVLSHGGLFRCALPEVLANVDAEFSEANPINHATVVIAEARAKGLFCTHWGEKTL